MRILPRFSSTPCCHARRLPARSAGPSRAGAGRAPRSRRKSGRPAPIPSPTSSAASTSPAARGIGTKDDPLVITRGAQSSNPVTLIIRTTKPIQPFSPAGEVANGFTVYAHRRAQQQRPGLDRVRVRAAGDHWTSRACSATACPSTSAAPTSDNICSDSFRRLRPRLRALRPAAVHATARSTR